MPTFVDGRADRLYDGFLPEIERTKGPGGDSLLRDQITRHDIAWSILPPDDERAAKFASFADWQQIYVDEVAVVFVRSETPK